MSDLPPISQSETPEDVGRNWQADDALISGRTMTMWGILLSLTILVAMVVTWGFWRWLNGGEVRIDNLAFFNEVREGQIVQGARLDPRKQQGRGAYERNQHEILTSYGWIDRSDDLARIPIDRAMTIYAERMKR